MRKLMISLDKKILDPTSAVAQRMIEYGKTDELFIIIPDKEKKSLDLSPTIHVRSTGGSNKMLRLLGLYRVGKKVIGNWNLEIGNCIITVQDPFFIGLVGWLLKRKFKIKLEIQMHGDFFGDYYKNQWLRLSLAKFILKRADKIRVVGERIKQNLTKFNKTYENKIEVRPVRESKYYMGEFIDFRKEYPQFQKIFVFVGRLVHVKNVDWLIRLFVEVVHKNHQCGLIIIGDGEQRKNLEKLVHGFDLQDNVIFRGWVEHPWHKIREVNALLFPSLSEGYGLVALEALVNGCPLVIMNDVGVANYELKPNERVKIIPVSDREAWIKAILEV